ncbi:hypothetical protein SUDANB121_03744 [Nocardiopsis dassonvillei]|uniref:DUF4352 domain-containing protein n=1 Tax=Nocardiopsis dassonvillei TaxID=2014 RepID=UPI003F54BFCF
MLRAVAIPVAVFIAGTGCIASVAALTAVPLPAVQVTVGEEQAPREPEPDPPTAGAEGSEEPGGPGRGPSEESGSGQDSAGSHTQSVPPESYTGATTAFGPFHVLVATCYTDTGVTDGMGTHATAPPGMEYHIYRLHVTNEGNAPAVFETAGTTALTTGGEQFVNDDEAEFAVAWDYLWDDIDPGATVTTYIIFEAPVGTEFAEVMLGGTAPITPN